MGLNFLYPVDWKHNHTNACAKPGSDEDTILCRNQLISGS